MGEEINTIYSMCTYSDLPRDFKPPSGEGSAPLFISYLDKPLHALEYLLGWDGGGHADAPPDQIAKTKKGDGGGGDKGQ